jgi:Fe-S-cluster containining protein
VPINHIDLQRLMRATGLAAGEIVRMYDSTEITFPLHREGWVRFSNGKRLMGLKKKKGRCMFLDNDRRCTVYAARPVTCRTYPLLVTYGRDGKFKGIEMLKRVQCRHGWGQPKSPQAVLRTARQEDREDRAYYARLRQWDWQNRPGGKAAFIKFIRYGFSSLMRLTKPQKDI